jgi:phosphoglycerate dehydrogenase-like enzyme
MSKLCVVLAKDAYDAFQPLFEAADLPVRYAILHDAETALVEGEPQDPSRLPANVIWMTKEGFRGPLRRTFKHLLETSPQLGWVHSIGAGYDMPIMQDVLKRGVRLTTSHVNSIPIAEFALRAVLDRFQRGDEMREARARKEYPREDFREIYRTTWLIYGLGAIGSRISERARVFGAHTIGVRRNPTGDEPVDELIKPAEVPDHLGRADVVVMSVPSSAETVNLVDSAFLARMKPGAVFVNVARAALMDEADVLAALDTGHLDYAILDVHSVEEAWLYRKERRDDSPLWTHPKVALTPHAAAHGGGRHLRSAELFIDNLRRYIAGEARLPDEVQLEGRPRAPADAL